MSGSHVERVWDYPRPPAVTLCRCRIRVELAGEALAESTRALRVLETSHPPTVYVPPDDVRGDLLAASGALNRDLSTNSFFEGLRPKSSQETAQILCSFQWLDQLFNHL